MTKAERMIVIVALAAMAMFQLAQVELLAKQGKELKQIKAQLVMIEQDTTNLDSLGTGLDEISGKLDEIKDGIPVEIER